ncbi:MAG: ABC transporter permease subunit [Planctomycetaceae bacterium]|nr:ABC transporter permease subunit [Planctomycetaceae bacterium]
MAHPIIQRELIGTMRTKRAFVLLLGAAVVFVLLVIGRWPGDATVELSGVQAQEVFRLFAYGLLAVLLLLVPAFPATSIVREKRQGTLTLLLCSPLSPWSVFWGKATGMLCFVMLILAMSVPAALAAYAMGGISIRSQLLPLYVILLLVLLQYTTLALMVSSMANSTDAALRITYALVLGLAVVALGPHFFLQGKPGLLPRLAESLRCVSPVPTMMEVAGHGDVGSFSAAASFPTMTRFLLFTAGSSVVFAGLTIMQLSTYLLDRPRPQGIVTNDRSLGARTLRRMVFLVDPHRRKTNIRWYMNPVMVKEFRTRRFGRTHWLLRLVSLAALASVLLTYAATTGTIEWGVGMIAGMMVVFQVALITVITPSLAANLISAERESGGWNLLLMTPLSAASILYGKLASVLLTLVLVLFATLPGYLVMIWIYPPLRWQVSQVLICLGWMILFATLLSAAVSSLCRRAATATTIAYGLLGTVCFGTMLFWFGRGTTFGHATIESILKINPMAAALTIIETPGFTTFNLVPANWWWMGGLCLVCAVVLLVQTWRLTRPL